MARTRLPGGSGRGMTATKARVREIVTAIAADVIAETVQRLAGSGARREAAPLRIRARTRSAKPATAKPRRRSQQA